MLADNKISIVIPAYNEDRNLEKLIPLLNEEMKKINMDYEIIAVDDGSTDNTREILKNLKLNFSAFRFSQLSDNKGQSQALWQGIKFSTGDIIITMDADMQTNPGEIHKMVKNFKDVDMVCGCRLKRHDDFIRIISTRVANFIRNAVLGSNIIDSACGFKIFKKECVEKLDFFDGIHRFMPDLFLMNGFKIKQIEVSHYQRVYGASKYNIRNRIGKSLKGLLMLRKVKSQKIPNNQVKKKLLNLLNLEK